MQVQSHPLEPFFHQAVRNSYEGRLGLGPEITSYVSRMLCEFTEADKLLAAARFEGAADREA